MPKSTSKENPVPADIDVAIEYAALQVAIAAGTAAAKQVRKMLQKKAILGKLEHEPVIFLTTPDSAVSAAGAGVCYLAVYSGYELVGWVQCNSDSEAHALGSAAVSGHPGSWYAVSSAIPQGY